MDIIKILQDRFGEKIKEIKVHSPQKIYVTIDKDSLLEFADFIFNKLDARFATITGLDNLDNFEVLYHFSLDKQNIIVSVRVMVARRNPEIESLVSIIKGTAWIEREMYELLGIKFLHHPNLKRFLLSEDWPEGVYPLRKEIKN